MIATPASLDQPAAARRRVIGFGMALAFISYLDRACISQAAPMIARDLHFNTIQMGYIFSAFGLTYAAMEVPSGWLIDRFGPRLVLTRVVLCWSFFTAATGFAWNFASMLTARLLFGAGEAGCFPGLAKTFSNWLPCGGAGPRGGLESGQRAVGRGRGTSAGGRALCIARLAGDVCLIRGGRDSFGRASFIYYSGAARRMRLRWPPGARPGGFSFDPEAPGRSASNGSVISMVSIST